MRRVIVAATAAVVLALVGGAAKVPLFVDWLQPTSPGDQTIKAYWQRAEVGEASPKELVDLGTMLFVRGFPNDARHFFEKAAAAIAAEPERSLDDDILHAEAWFRIGLVEHSQGHLRAARKAYRHCLKILKGHGRCNFYMGLLEEQTGHPKSALEYYHEAFKVAPELADPSVNPAVLYSTLDVGALVRVDEHRRFSTDLPLGYVEPGRVSAVLQRFLPTPTPTPTPAATPTPEPPTAGAETHATPTVRVLPRVRSHEREQEPPAAEPSAAIEQPSAANEEQRPALQMPEALRERLEQLRQKRKQEGQHLAPPKRPGEPAPTPTPS